jgi:hypothetical protein
MKKWIIAACIVCTAAFVQAKQAVPRGETKEQFLEAQKKKAQDTGRKYRQDNAEKVFHKMDANQDGIVTLKERQEYQKSVKDPAGKVIILG